MRLPSLSSRSGTAAAGSPWSAGWPSWAPRSRYHREIGELLAPIDHVIAVGELARGYGTGEWVRDADEAAKRLAELLQPGDVVLVKGSRSVGLEAVAQNSQLMERVLAAGLLAMIISIVAGPKFIDFLRRNEMGQHIREEGPAGHRIKQGTPTMGGLLLVFSATVAFLALSHYTTEGLAVFGVMLGCAAVGFADDYTKLRHRRSLGLSGRWKLVLLAAITVGLAFAVEEVNAPSELYVPVVDWRFGSPSASTSCFPDRGRGGERREPDGRIDGLAAGIGIIALLTLTAMNVVAYTRSGQFQAEQDLASLDMAILGAALIGGTIGFLWYNAFPAEVIMGDTGSMAIGGAIGPRGDEPQRAAPAPDRRDLRDRGALGDPPGGLLQVLGPPDLPDGADPPPLRDESLVGDEDHGALLDRRRDPVRRRVRALLPLLPGLPPRPGRMTYLVLGLARSGPGGGPRACAAGRPRRGR